MLEYLTEDVVHGGPLTILLPVLVVTAWLVRAALRQRARPALIVYGALQVLAGMLLVDLMVGHIIGVVVRRITLKEEMWVRFEPHVRFAGVPYDFRIYSLVLFAVLGAWAGIVYVRSGWRTTRGDAQAWRGATRASVGLAALVAPLLPLQAFFALQMLVLSAFGLTVALASRRSLESRLAMNAEIPAGQASTVQRSPAGLGAD